MLHVTSGIEKYLHFFASCLDPVPAACSETSFILTQYSRTRVNGVFFSKFNENWKPDQTQVTSPEHALPPEVRSRNYSSAMQFRPNCFLIWSRYVDCNETTSVIDELGSMTKRSWSILTHQSITSVERLSKTTITDLRSRKRKSKDLHPLNISASFLNSDISTLSCERRVSNWKTSGPIQGSSPGPQILHEMYLFVWRRCQ